MGLLNWAVAKAMGLPSVEENCKSAVLVFLGQNDITEPKLEAYRGQPSGTNSKFYRRLYAGSGRRQGQAVYFILDVNEDIPRPHGLLWDRPIPDLSAAYREWLLIGEYRGSLFHFIAEKLTDPSAKLDAR